ncbi:MAG: hypothetical protein GXX90_03795 [Microbacteriaceae bacterium]|nr:hypothetical protein [Microbacteriaceae bacterium]
MSNARKTPAGNAYRTGYLRSRAWFARRDRYFAGAGDERRRCAVCGRPEENPKRALELHHVSYRGVSQRPDGTWVAGEADADLIPMHPLCHEQVHRVIDADQALRSLVSRQEATRRAIRVVRRRLIDLLNAEIEGDRT